jgi:hypothetical protein
MTSLKILLVCHDAGGANILFSLVEKYQSNFDWRLVCAGPAKVIFSPLKTLKNFQPGNSQRIERTLNSFKPDLILTGTSGKSNLEKIFIKIAKKNNFKTASFLDHWCNYLDRFGNYHSWKKNLPDFILVGDQWAYKLALKNNFSPEILLKVENPYFEKAIKVGQKLAYRKKINPKKYPRILYLSEPNNSTQVKLLKKLRSHFFLLRIRPHPSESFSKRSLFQDCLWADIVIGHRTMALFIASLMKKKVISYQPNLLSSLIFPSNSIKTTSSIENLLKLIQNPKLIPESGSFKYIYNSANYPFTYIFSRI